MNAPRMRETPTLSNERFGFTLVVSACVHAVLILGVGFHLASEPAPPRGLDITLAQYRSEMAPDQADFLAQENQRGSGTGQERTAPTTPLDAPFHAATITQVQPLPQGAAQASPAAPRQAVLAARTPRPGEVTRQTPEQLPDSTLDTVQPSQAEAATNASVASLRAQLDLQRQAYARSPRRYTLTSASTRKDRDAVYLDGWRKQIEAVGNSNYPRQASRDGVYGTLRLLVALRHDGSVSEVRILSSSGHAVLDQAAIRIVRLAAPFAPLPESLREETDILEIIRTWRFHRGDSFSSL